MTGKQRLQTAAMLISILLSIVVGYGDLLARWSGWSRSSIWWLIILLLLVLAGLAFAIYHIRDEGAADAVAPTVGRRLMWVLAGAVLIILIEVIVMIALRDVFAISGARTRSITGTITAAIIALSFLYFLRREMRR
jgi:hypothetical protein